MEKLKILIPTDFSVQAEFAYLMVKRLEEKIATEIHFVHVLPVPDTVTMDANGTIQTCGEIDVQFVVQQKEIAQRKLANLSTLYGENIQSHLVLGKLTDGILNFSQQHHFDLIVMGTKGAWGLKEKISGSETQIIARRSSIPVLSLMCDRSELKIEHILLVHNFNNPANENLALLHKLIKALNTQLHLLQISSYDLSEEQLTIENNMKKFAELNGIENYVCHVLNDKDVENGVIHFTQMFTADIVCIGTHGKGGLLHASATEKLINHLFKPIISFHLNKSSV
jgi:nucleotide-binding universal stress UspA family protein